MLGLQYLDMPNLRGRKDHKREQERSGSDHEAGLDEEFDFGSAEEAKSGSAEEVHGGSNRTEESKGMKIEDESETAGSVQMFDSETPNELTRRQHRENKGLGKGGTSREANQKGRGAWYRTGRGARVRREARRN
mgnify:CR=1 FL=1